MKTWMTAALLTLALVALGWWSHRGLSQKPTPLFLAVESPDELDAFQVGLCLSGVPGTLSPVTLTAAQSQQLRDAFDRKDPGPARQVAQALGLGPLVVGMSGPPGGWPWFIGGGPAGLWGRDPGVVFDDLTFGDKVYLCLASAPPAGLPLAGVPAPDGAGATPARAVSSAEGAVVHIKILNGCGITNAADWAAGRLKGPGVVITQVGNADQFHYPKTLVKSSVGTPVALSDALDRMGLDADRVEAMDNPSGDADVVVVVGRDYLSMRGKRNGRIHNGKK